MPFAAVAIIVALFGMTHAIGNWRGDPVADLLLNVVDELEKQNSVSKHQGPP